VSLAA